MYILRAKPEDAATLTEIALTAKKHWGYPERWIESWRGILTISPDFIGQHETYAARVDDQAVGFYALVSQSNQMSLEHLWVLPNLMRRGIGRALFNHAVERARALGFATVLIESDPNAERFYTRMGARLIGSKVSELDGQQRLLPVFIMSSARSDQGGQAAKNQTV